MSVNNSYMDAGAELKKLRERTGLSLEAVAKHLGMTRGTVYAHYETRLKDKFVPMHIVNKLIPLFVPRGVKEEELLKLGGVEERHINRIRVNQQILKDLLKYVPLVSEEEGLDPDPDTMAKLIADIYPAACDLKPSGLSHEIVRLAVSGAKSRRERET